MWSTLYLVKSTLGTGRQLRAYATARRKHLQRMKTGSRSHLKKYPVTILDFLAVLHGYRRSFEAEFFVYHFLTRACMP